MPCIVVHFPPKIRETVTVLIDSPHIVVCVCISMAFCHVELYGITHT